MARNTLKLNTKGFEEMLRQLDSLDGDVKRAVEEALQQSAERIQIDTHLAMQKNYLPAQGKYWTGKTSESIVSDSTVKWEGMTGWVPVGFDFSKAGAGGFLITGTPRMSPDPMLNKMYKQKKYMNGIQKDMAEVIMKHIVQKMTEGG